MAKHQLRHWISIAGKVIGAVVIAGPAITAVSANINSPAQIPGTIVYEYFGYNPNVANATIDTSKLLTGVGSIVGGLVLMKVFSYLARRF